MSNTSSLRTSWKYIEVELLPSQMLYSTAPVTQSSGMDLINRGELDTAQTWTMVDFSNPISATSQVISVSFYASNTKSLRVGLYRPTSGTTFTVVKQLDVSHSTGVVVVSLYHILMFQN